MIAPHESTRFWTPDEVAEALDGVSLATSSRLWSLMDEHMGEDTHPLGGDGSDGTIEVPQEPEDRHSCAALWPHLTPEERLEINEAFKAMEFER